MRGGGATRIAASGLLLAVAWAAPACGTWSAPWQGGSAPESGVAEGLRRQLEAEDREVRAIAPPPPARGASAPAPAVWLEVERPSGPDAPTVHTAWLEVAGFAGARERRRYDVVIVLDVSGSTQYASGADVNGNGVIGRRTRRIDGRARDRRAYCSDPGDTVLDAERVATRRLLARLDPRRTRIGLVSFSDVARPRAPLGSSPELLDLVLDDLADDFGAGRTNLAEATRLAARMLTEADGYGAPGRTDGYRDAAPDPVVLILSDGYPTWPRSEAHAAQAALEAAREAARAGVRVSSFALGIDAPRAPDEDVFARMAALTGGQHVRVETPGDVVEALPGVDLARVAAVDVENATSGEDARAPRVRPDGRFDAWVRLRPGPNRLRITARGATGGVSSVERTVVYDDSVPPDPEEVARIQRELELRTLEMELERDVRAGKAAQRKVIRIEPDAVEHD